MKRHRRIINSLDNKMKDMRKNMQFVLIHEFGQKCAFVSLIHFTLPSQNLALRPVKERRICPNKCIV